MQQIPGIYTALLRATALRRSPCFALSSVDPRLGEAKTGFRELLQHVHVLQDQAEKLLARGNLTQGEIAFLLGYSEVSAFSRACRGWTGIRRAPRARDSARNHFGA